MSQVPVTHFIGVRPSAGPSYEAARLTRAELLAATDGHFAHGVNTLDVIDKVCACHARLNEIDGRRLSSGTLVGADVADYAANVTSAAALMRRLGLYPQTWKGPAHVG